MTAASHGFNVSTTTSGGWAVRRTGAKRASRIFKSRSGALGWARRRATSEGLPVYVHRRDGLVCRKIEP